MEENITITVDQNGQCWNACQDDGAPLDCGAFGRRLSVGQTVLVPGRGSCRIDEIGDTIHTGPAGVANYVYVTLSRIGGAS